MENDYPSVYGTGLSIMEFFSLSSYFKTPMDYIPDFADLEYAPDNYFDDFWKTNNLNNNNFRLHGFLYEKIVMQELFKHPNKTSFTIPLVWTGYNNGVDITRLITTNLYEIFDLIKFFLMYIDNPLQKYCAPDCANYNVQIQFKLVTHDIDLEFLCNESGLEQFTLDPLSIYQQVYKYLEVESTTNQNQSTTNQTQGGPVDDKINLKTPSMESEVPQLKIKRVRP